MPTMSKQPMGEVERVVTELMEERTKLYTQLQQEHIAYGELKRLNADLLEALKDIATISQDDLREAMRHGDTMHVLGAMTGLFNRCRDIADKAIAKAEGK